MRKAIPVNKQRLLVLNSENGLKPMLMLFLVLTATVLLSGCASFWGEPIEPGNKAPDIFEVRQQAEQAYLESRWIESVRLYQSLVERNPGDSAAWFRLGNVYAQQGAFERAINAYQTSLSSDADQPKAWFNLSTAYLLNAQSAMQDARDRLEDSDPAKQLIVERLTALSALVHGRFEEGVVAPASHVR